MEALGVVVDRRWETEWRGTPPEVRWQGLARSGQGPPGRGGGAPIDREGGGVGTQRGRRWSEAWRGRHLRRGGGEVKAGWPG